MVKGIKHILAYMYMFMLMLVSTEPERKELSHFTLCQIFIDRYLNESKNEYFGFGTILMQGE